MDRNHWVVKLTYVIDVIIWIIFLADLCLKLYIHPLYKKKRALMILGYIVDLAILVVSVFYLFGNSRLSWARILRIFKVLMVIKKLDFLRTVVDGLLASVKDITQIFIFLLAIYFALDIMLVRYYAGVFYYCDSTNISNKLEISTLYNIPGISSLKDEKACIDFGGDWLNSNLNFDNIFQGWRTTFILSTGESWVDIMWSSFTNQGISNLALQTELIDEFRLSGVFFIIIYIFFDFFFIDLVTGVVVDAFSSHKQQNAGMIYLSKIQQDWVYLQYYIMEHKPLDLVGFGKGKVR